ncbi:hypothetical protein F4811DRAFT_312683 [Daldinia bambusicola]|nr:hypothetical protein F4811DRAFT_312683 [Daldinia bambusicola]
MCWIHRTWTVCSTCKNITIGVNRIEHCFIRELCEEVDSISHCPHYREASYYSHLNILSASESHQCHHCLAGVKAPRQSDVKGSFKGMGRFLRRGTVDYPEPVREEIDLDLRTYTLTTGLDTPQQTPITFHLREDVKVGPLDCLRLWVQNLSSENEIETATRHLERLRDKLRHRGEDRNATTEVLRSEENGSGFDAVMNQSLSLLSDHIRGRIGAGPPRSLNDIDEIMEDIANETDDFEPLNAYMHTLLDTLKCISRDLEAERETSCDTDLDGSDSSRLSSETLPSNESGAGEPENSSYLEENPAIYQDGEEDFETRPITANVDSMDREMSPSLDMSQAVPVSQHFRCFDEMVADERSRSYDYLTTRRFRGPGDLR